MRVIVFDTEAYHSIPSTRLLARRDALHFWTSQIEECHRLAGPVSNNEVANLTATNSFGALPLGSFQRKPT